MVTNNWSLTQTLKFQLWASLGYVVVVLDGRGSSRRGKAFEASLYRNLGQIELEDQVKGLNFCQKHLLPAMDLSRVCITGWSYGGYLAALGALRYSAFFKCAVAGAPVTDWRYYDSVYSERYLGDPIAEGAAYRRASLLSLVREAPLDSDCIMFVHGLLDENVHTSHTMALIEQFVLHGKPYRLQLLPRERHGLRGLQSVVHFEYTFLLYISEKL